LIKAYTVETGFYSVLNRQLANEQDLEGSDEDGNHARRGIHEILKYNPFFVPYTYTGLTYRGMRITGNVLKQYRVNSKIMNKAFLSTTKGQKIAETFFEWNDNSADGESYKFPALCKYNIKHDRTALDIETLSEYPTEKELLITHVAENG
jgi:hypothetical protein